MPGDKEWLTCARASSARPGPARRAVNAAFALIGEARHDGDDV